MHRRGIQESDEDEEEDETYNDVVPESPYSCEDSNISKPTPKKRRRNVAKRVVSVPIADVERSKRRGEVYPPSDSWAWRKYGQKPIKGSPYPRGYYRCSSSKGCPARKQLERNRIDPTKLIITYASDHNHPFPSASNHKSHHHKTTTTTTVVIKSTKKQKNLKQEEEPMGLDLSHVDPPLLLGGYYGEFEWFYDASSSGSSSVIDVNLERGFSVGGEEEDESLFGDLDDLPDCASVFRRGTVVTTTEEEEQHRRCDFGAISLCDSSR